MSVCCVRKIRESKRFMRHVIEWYWREGKEYFYPRRPFLLLWQYLSLTFICHAIKMCKSNRSRISPADDCFWSSSICDGAAYSFMIYMLNKWLKANQTESRKRGKGKNDIEKNKEKKYMLIVYQRMVPVIHSDDDT